MKKSETCLGCKYHEVINNRDPGDWFCDDDCAVICKLTKNPHRDITSEYSSDRQEFRKVASSCRPYNVKKESVIPKWCPKKKKGKPI